MLASHINPNLFAYFALLIWPVVAAVLFTRLPPSRALIWTLLAAYLLLPWKAGIKLPMMPFFDKDAIPNIAATICCYFFTRRKPKFFYGFGIVEALLSLIIVGPFITSLLNTDPLVVPSQVIPGVGPYDAAAEVLTQFVVMLPFFLGRQLLRATQDIFEIMRALALAGLAYILPMLFEIRMSPQLNIWVYGYFPHSFGQQIRDGGFRPVVFIGHGLRLAFFFMTTLAAAATLWRLRARVLRIPAGGVVALFVPVLVLCKTLSALVFAVVAVPLVRWARPRTQVRVAMVLMLLTLAYPVARTEGYVPTAKIVQWAAVVSKDRSDSIKFRFDNENMLLTKASQRIWFGWGRYGRSLIYSDNPNDPSVQSVVDGYWIGALGGSGIVGFVGVFGLLGYCVFRAALAFKYARSREDQVLLASLALIVSIYMIDLLPNSAIYSWTWLLVGCLLGRAEALYAVGRERFPLGPRATTAGVLDKIGAFGR